MNPYAVKYGLGRAWGYSVLSLGAWPFYWLYSIALGRVNEFWDARTLGLATEASHRPDVV